MVGLIISLSMQKLSGTDCILLHDNAWMQTFDFSICMIQNRKRTHEISLAKFQYNGVTDYCSS